MKVMTVEERILDYLNDIKKIGRVIVLELILIIVSLVLWL